MSTDGEDAASRRFSGHLALWVVQLCFALFPVFGKLAFEQPGGFEPLAVGAWRMLFGAATLGTLAFVLHGRAALPCGGDLAVLALGSVLGITLNMLLYLQGLHRSTPTNAAILMGLIPVFTFAFAAALGQEKLRAGRALGVAVALVGASMRFWAEDGALLREHALGNLLMVANTLCYAAYFVITRPIARRIPALVVVAWVFLFSAPLAPFVAAGHPLVPEEVSARAWWSLAFILVFPTSLAYLLNVYALARVGASTAAIYVFAQPVITAVTSHLVLGEELTRGMLVSAAVTFFGIYLVARVPKAAPPAVQGNTARP